MKTSNDEEDRNTVFHRHIFVRIALIAVLLIAAWQFGMSENSGEEQTILEITAAAFPGELVEPGEVDLYFLIENVSEVDAQGVVLLYDGEQIETVGTLPAGERTEVNLIHNVTAEELDNGSITYRFSSADLQISGGSVDYEVNCPVSKIDPLPELSISRRFSKKSVSPGESIAIVYSLYNTGNVDLESLVLSDSLGEYSEEVEVLKAGEVRVLINRTELTDTDYSSVKTECRAAVTGEVLTYTLEDVPIEISEPYLEISFSLQGEAFSQDTATAMLVLTNVGNVDYKDLTVYDDNNGCVIAEHVDVLADGKPVEINRSYHIVEGFSIRWCVCGDDADGHSVKLKTEDLSLEAESPKDPADVSVWAETSTPKLKKNGKATVIVHIVNGGDAAVENAVLYEETMGVIASFVMMPASGSIDRTVSVDIDEDSYFSFILDYTDAEDWKQTTKAAPLAIMIASDGVLPDGEREQEMYEGRPIRLQGNSFYIAILIAGVVVLIALVIILVIATRRAKFEERVQQEILRQRRKSNANRRRKK